VGLLGQVGFEAGFGLEVGFEAGFQLIKRSKTKQKTTDFFQKHPKNPCFKRDEVGFHRDLKWDLKRQGRYQHTTT
jgi:hypothetical protein